MKFVRGTEFLDIVLSFFSRLYLLSIVAVIVVVIGGIFDIPELMAYNYQAIGSLLVTGGIWFISLAVYAAYTEQSGQPDPNLQPSANNAEIKHLAR